MAKQVQIKKQVKPVKSVEIDTRTPSGKKLPY